MLLISHYSIRTNSIFTDPRFYYSRMCKAGLVPFVKEQVSKEILEKKERIPGAIITVWILFLLIFYDMAILFVFGIFPIIIYFTVQMIKNAPTNWINRIRGPLRERRGLWNNPHKPFKKHKPIHNIRTGGLVYPSKNRLRSRPITCMVAMNSGQPF